MKTQLEIVEEMYIKPTFKNPILRALYNTGELINDDRFRVIICPHSDNQNKVVAMIDDTEPDGYLCLHNSDDDGSNDFADVTLFERIGY